MKSTYKDEAFAKVLLAHTWCKSDPCFHGWSIIIQLWAENTLCCPKKLEIWMRINKKEFCSWIFLKKKTVDNPAGHSHLFWLTLGIILMLAGFSEKADEKTCKSYLSKEFSDRLRFDYLPNLYSGLKSRFHFHGTSRNNKTCKKRSKNEYILPHSYFQALCNRFWYALQEGVPFVNIIWCSTVCKSECDISVSKLFQFLDDERPHYRKP